MHSGDFFKKAQNEFSIYLTALIQPLGELINDFCGQHSVPFVRWGCKTNDSAYKYNYIFIFYIIYIMNNISPNVKPIDEITYEFPQSKYEVVPKVSF